MVMAVLIIFLVIFQTVINLRMLSIQGQGLICMYSYSCTLMSIELKQ